jgi:hypothetical protein
MLPFPLLPNTFTDAISDTDITQNRDDMLMCCVRIVFLKTVFERPSRRWDDNIKIIF